MRVPKISEENCECERSGNEAVRLKCFRKYLTQFFQQRRYPNTVNIVNTLFSNCSAVKFVQFDSVLDKIQPITNRVTESVILLQCIRNYAGNHVKFATETRCVDNFKRSVELFKDL